MRFWVGFFWSIKITRKGMKFFLKTLIVALNWAFIILFKELLLNFWLKWSLIDLWIFLLDVFKNVYFSLNPDRSQLRDVLQTMSTNIDNIDQLYIDQFYRYASTNTSLPDLLSQMTPFDDDLLRGLAIPTLVLIGDQDIINSPASLEQARQILPCVETAIVANAGHFLSVDNAHSVNNRVLQFISATTKYNGCKMQDK